MTRGVTDWRIRFHTWQLEFIAVVSGACSFENLVRCCCLTKTSPGPAPILTSTQRRAGSPSFWCTLGFPGEESLVALTAAVTLKKLDFAAAHGMDTQQQMLIAGEVEWVFSSS